MSEPCVLAVDAGGTSLKAALAQPGGRIVPDSFLQVPVDSRGSAEEIAGAYSALARDAGKLAGKLGLEIVRASVCIPGPFDYAGGISLMKHKYQSVFGVPLRPWFIKTLGNIPVTFLHDSTAFLLGAVKAEELARHRRICGVIIGTGLGFASMYDGQMNLNPQGGPGISIFARPFGAGTAEDYVSRRAIERAYSKKHPQRAVPSVKDIAGLAMAGDPVAADCFKDMGRRLGQVLRDIIEKEQFTLVLLGGAISKSSELFIPQLRDALPGLNAEIRPAGDIDLAPLLGAAKS